jgi:hypothetical protein
MEKTEIKDINQALVSNFFETYKNFSIKNSEILSQHEKNINLIRNTFMRFVADKYKTFSSDIFQNIIANCIDSNLHLINFDDGSNLYKDPLLEEIKKYVDENFSSFSVEFQEKLKKVYTKN